MKLYRFISMFLFLTLWLNSPLLYGQSKKIIELSNELNQLKRKKGFLLDTVYLKTLNKLAYYYADAMPDSALILMQNQVANCNKAGYHRGEVSAFTNQGNAYQTKGDFEKALRYYDSAVLVAKNNKLKGILPGVIGNIGLAYSNQGRYPEALDKYYESLEAAQAENNKLLVGSALNNIATVHFYQGKMEDADSAYKITLEIAQELKDSVRAIYALNNIGEVKLELNQVDSALHYFKEAFSLSVIKSNNEMQTAITNNLGNSYLRLDSLSLASNQFERALKLSTENDYAKAKCKAMIGLAKVRFKQGNLKEALQFGLDGFKKAEEMGQTQLLRDVSKVLSEVYQKAGDGMNALKYYKAYDLYADSLDNVTNEKAAANERANYLVSQNRAMFDKKSLQQRWIIFSILAACVTLGIILWIIYRNKKKLGNTYRDLKEKSELINQQKVEVEETLKQLRDTQGQLVHAEKMASLGELTAGIAHEIQNPLNFVNNFSEVSKELLDEMKESLDKGNTNEAKEIMVDIINNLDKINHHGKRADAIVKSMLQHSRTNTGQKELTDINSLCDEYLRLSYHGLRAKDKSFNAKFETNLDPSVSKINVVPQEIGRVLLNLINNAFYACKERSRASANSADGYEPEVLVATKKENNKVLISVSDNGNGIPPNIMDKIFQPFFTTKPTGQGTGLGLSLAYDIITKGHQGDLKVESGQGKGTTFIIQLPL